MFFLDVKVAFEVCEVLFVCSSEAVYALVEVSDDGDVFVWCDVFEQVCLEFVGVLEFVDDDVVVVVGDVGVFFEECECVDS